MRLTEIISGLEYSLIYGNLEKEVSTIVYDSREVVENSIFVAITGFSMDGHRFIKQAINKGATTIIVEKDVRQELDLAAQLAPQLKQRLTLLKVNNSRQALALLSANYYGHPTEKLNLVGITGTNGKTSITYFLKSILEQVGQQVGVIGTMGTVMGQKVSKNKNTTPESRQLQELFAHMVEEEIKTCLMEVSSHALSLDRVAYSQFNTAIFTNLSPDHLELHSTMEEYFQAKASLFKLTSDYHIVNVDDPYGQRLYAQLQQRQKAEGQKSAGEGLLFSYGLEKGADIYATDIVYSANGSTFTAHTPRGTVRLKVNLPGKIYVYNSLAALACAYCNQIPLSVIAKGIEAVERIKGRFEVVYEQDDYKIIIDFAHTEDALEKALTTLKPYAKGRMILVFGVYAAPGELGRGKREAMGKVAAKYADLAVVTSDNPKDQNPEAILDEIISALAAEGGTYKAIVDRQEAIQYAIDVSTKEDIILIAGKGHETSQVIGKEEIPFNEAEIVLETIKRKNQLVGS